MSAILKSKYSLIDKKRISQQAQDALEEVVEATDNFKKVSAPLKKEFLNFYNRLKAAKPEAIRGTKEYKSYGASGAGKPSATPEPSKAFAAAIKKARENRKAQGLSTSGDDIKRDAGRPALRAGKRRSKETGNVYYEYRENRIDRRPQRFPKLEDGGNVGRNEMGELELHTNEEHRYKNGGGMSKYPELDAIASEIARYVAMKINFETKDVTSKMPYKAQYVLEKVIEDLQERV